MPTVRSFLAGAMDQKASKGGEVEIQPTLSFEATPEVGVSALVENPVQSPPWDEGRSIDLSSGSELSVPMAEDQVV